MLHECNYCHEHKSIKAFHESQEDVICRDCYAYGQEQYYDALEEVGMLPTTEEDLPL